MDISRSKLFTSYGKSFEEEKDYDPIDRIEKDIDNLLDSPIASTPTLSLEHRVKTLSRIFQCRIPNNWFTKGPDTYYFQCAYLSRQIRKNPLPHTSKSIETLEKYLSWVEAELKFKVRQETFRA